MGASASVEVNNLILDGSDIQSHAQAVAEVKKIRALLLTNNNARIANLLCMTPVELEAHHQSVLTAMTKREVERKKEMIEAEKRGDYSKCHSGTAEDTKNEAEAAALLKGAVDDDGGEGDASGEYQILKSIDSINLSTKARSALEKRGKWMKYMNMNDCYGYVHGLTLEVRGNKPDTYIDEDEERKEEEEKEKKKKDKKKQLRKIEPKQLKEVIKEVENTANKTLLLLTDGEHDETLRTYFTMHGVVCDLSPLGFNIKKQRAEGIRVKSVMEDCRQATVKALKNGSMMGIFLGDIDGEDLPIMEKLCKNKKLGGPTVFPKQLFENKGKGLFTKFAAGSGSKLHLHRLYRDDDKDVSGGCVFKISFQTIIISNANMFTYKRQLKNCFPTLDNFEIVVVE